MSTLTPALIGDWLAHPEEEPFEWRRRQPPEVWGSIVYRRYCKQPPDTLAAIGAELGMTGANVRRIEQRALRMLRRPSRLIPIRKSGLVEHGSELQWALVADNYTRDEWPL